MSGLPIRRGGAGGGGADDYELLLAAQQQQQQQQLSRLLAGQSAATATTTLQALPPHLAQALQSQQAVALPPGTTATHHAILVDPSQLASLTGAAGGAGGLTLALAQPPFAGAAPVPLVGGEHHARLLAAAAAERGRLGYFTANAAPNPAAALRRAAAGGAQAPTPATVNGVYSSPGGSASSRSGTPALRAQPVRSPARGGEDVAGGAGAPQLAVANGTATTTMRREQLVRERLQLRGQLEEQVRLRERLMEQRQHHQRSTEMRRHQRNQQGREGGGDSVEVIDVETEWEEQHQQQERRRGSRDLGSRGKRQHGSGESAARTARAQQQQVHQRSASRGGGETASSKDPSHAQQGANSTAVARDPEAQLRRQHAQGRQALDAARNEEQQVIRRSSGKESQNPSKSSLTDHGSNERKGASASGDKPGRPSDAAIAAAVRAQSNQRSQISAGEAAARQRHVAADHQRGSQAPPSRPAGGVATASTAGVAPAQSLAHRYDPPQPPPRQAVNAAQQQSLEQRMAVAEAQRQLIHNAGASFPQGVVAGRAVPTRLMALQGAGRPGPQVPKIHSPSVNQQQQQQLQQQRHAQAQLAAGKNSQHIRRASGGDESLASKQRQQPTGTGHRHPTPAGGSQHAATVVAAPPPPARPPQHQQNNGSNPQNSRMDRDHLLVDDKTGIPASILAAAAAASPRRAAQAQAQEQQQIRNASRKKRHREPDAEVVMVVPPPNHGATAAASTGMSEPVDVVLMADSDVTTARIADILTGIVIPGTDQPNTAILIEPSQIGKVCKWIQARMLKMNNSASPAAMAAAAAAAQPPLPPAAPPPPHLMTGAAAAAAAANKKLKESNHVAIMVNKDLKGQLEQARNQNALLRSELEYYQRASAESTMQQRRSGERALVSYMKASVHSLKTVKQQQRLQQRKRKRNEAETPAGQSDKTAGNSNQSTTVAAANGATNRVPAIEQEASRKRAAVDGIGKGQMEPRPPVSATMKRGVGKPAGKRAIAQEQHKPPPQQQQQQRSAIMNGSGSNGNRSSTGSATSGASSGAMFAALLNAAQGVPAAAARATVGRPKPGEVQHTAKVDTTRHAAPKAPAPTTANEQGNKGAAPAAPTNGAVSRQPNGVPDSKKD